MERPPRPLGITLFTMLLLLAALATGYIGLSIKGFLVPAISLLVAATMLWLGRGRKAFVGLLIVNLVSGVGTDLIVALGDGLGHRKLDLSGVALLINTATGGPLMGVLSLPLLAALWWSPKLRGWFSGKAHEVRA